jgi:AcrR family transcriptional regulator
MSKDFKPSGDSLQRDLQPNAPRRETAPNGTPLAAPDVTERVRDVLSTLAAQPARDPVTNRFVAQTLAGGKTLLRSEQYWRAIEPLKQELVATVHRDQALDDTTPETLRGLIDGYAEARLFRTSMFLRLVDQGGPITSKGRMRALYKAYLDALDRETKLAQVIGLARKTKQIDLARDFAAAERDR